MPRWAIITIIAGVDFSQCAATIINGGRFATTRRGSIVRAADGAPHVQSINVGVKGLGFGINMQYADADLINQARVAINTAEAAQAAFVVHIQDALYDINVWAYPDYDVDEWLSTGPESEGIIENVTFRFVALSSAA